MKNKDFEKLFGSVQPVLPSRELKDRVIESSAKIPVIQEKPINKFFLFVRRYGVALGMLVLTLVASLTVFGFYSESYYEVYIDVNPSIEVNVNRFGVVSRVDLLNDDAEDCLKGIDLKGRKPEEAITVIATVLSENGYFGEDSELFISGYSESFSGIEQTVGALYYRLTDLTEQQGYGVEVFTGAFTKEQREMAAKSNLSPLKYSIISELLELDDGYTMRELSDFSMARLNELYTTLSAYISEDDILVARQNNLSPMRYELIKTLSDMGCKEEELSPLTTAELKSLLKTKNTSKIDEFNKDVDLLAEKNGFNTDAERAKFRVIYSITMRDPTYTVEGLRNKSMFELKALDYALEKYDVIKDLFG